MNNIIIIDNVEYVRKDSVIPLAKVDNLDYVIIRTQNAGVHAGVLKAKKGDEVELVNARRIWYWDGAASLSQLAMEGTNKPENCKFPTEVTGIVLQGVIETIQCTEKAMVSIKGVPTWAK